MDDEIEPLLVEVRASTQGFAQDIASMRTTLDSTLLDGFDRAGGVLERGLVGAIRRGSLGFDDLKRIALNTINEISAQAARNLFSSLPGGGIAGLFGNSGPAAGHPGTASGAGGFVGNFLGLGGLLGSVLGLPGRATGGPVAPGRGYLVGERGPELFVPTSSGRVENFENPGGARPAGARDVRVSIAINSPRGASVPQSLQRSGRQVASAVRRAIAYT